MILTPRESHSPKSQKPLVFSIKGKNRRRRRWPLGNLISHPFSPFLVLEVTYVHTYDSSAMAYFLCDPEEPSKP